ncbi:MAG: 50S ribosomal protein L6 [Ardenticatenaceae bacterium]|nr:50S ribosomal protein L6 [Anaerolineales bacterium]MCB8916786.1 50S ribosomal protein L6 [Ardenticatenaceae bacterium]
MSRIGKMPITVPSGVKVEIDGSQVSVSGAKGKLNQSFHPDMTINMEDNVLTVQRPSDAKEHRSLHGLTRALLNNMVTGVSTGFTQKLIVEGVGYRAEMNGDKLVLFVGYSHPIEFVGSKTLSFEVENRGKTILVSGIDKQVVGEICAQIRKTRPPEPYKGKGIRYENEIIRRKAGKAGKV